MNIAKNAAVDGKMVEIVSPETFGRNQPLYNNTSTAIEVERDGVMYALPVRSSMDDRPGVYDAGCLYFMRYPDEKEVCKYDMSKIDVVDYSDTKGMSEYLNKRQQLRDIESEILTDVDNVFIPTITEQDSAEMKALKEATRLKHCDINKYSQRFGDNFLNNKRIFKGNSVTMKKMIELADGLDMEIELRIRDKSADVPNPIGKEIIAILTGGAENGDE